MNTFVFFRLPDRPTPLPLSPRRPGRVSVLTTLALLWTWIAHAESMTHEPQPATIGEAGPVWHSRPGPWGSLDIRGIYLEAPDGRVDGLRQPSSTTGWNFPGASEASLTALFEAAGLSKEDQARLLNPSRILQHEHVLTLFPEPAILTGMTLAQRSVIYSELAKSTLNPMHESPAYVTGNRVDDWLHQAQLTDPQKDMLHQLLWKDGDLLAFSDVSLLLTLATSDAEVLHIFKFMTRVRALVVHLNLPQGADLQPLAHYWTASGLSIEGLPLLTSEAASGQPSCSIDITHLLPPIPRRLLYTYPTLASAASGRLPDCQWTAFNFFNAEPHEYYLDSRLTVARLREAYEPVEPPFKYGDILELVTKDGDAVHGCVYIADDIVFTKNGDGMIRPWVLMWLSDVENLYLREAGMKIIGRRLKPATP